MIKAMLFALFVFSFSLWGAEPKVVGFDKLQKRWKAGSQLYPSAHSRVTYADGVEKKMDVNKRDGA